MGKVNLKIPAAYPKQEEFFKSEARYIAYGGARGGGKSWAARIKAVLLCLEYEGIQILFMRRDLHSLRENHIYPLLTLLRGIAAYKSSTREFVFESGSRIVLGYCANEKDVLQYQGQSYDVIFMEEATQFTEFMFQTLTESNRSSGQIKKAFKPRMYFTCNPGGVGHTWVKRLFIDRRYRGAEKSDDYVFIPSKVYDNRYLMENSPDYVRALESLPPKRRRAMLDGDWDIFEGQYFEEFDRKIHVINPTSMPEFVTRYRSIDYGLDMLACLWIGIDKNCRAYVYRELYESGVLISDAAKKINALSEGEDIPISYAPPDLFSRRQDSGKSAIDIFGEHHLYFYKADSARVAGWYALKEWLKPSACSDGVVRPSLYIGENCLNLIRTLPALQFDSVNPNDVSNHPHELTHAPDALRLFAYNVRIPRNSYGTFDEGEDDEENPYQSFLDYGVNRKI